MKVKITVGSVEIKTEGLEMSQRQISTLLAKAAAIAVAVDVVAEHEEPKSTPIGFSATLELDPERNVEPDLSEWFEESP